MYWFLQFLVACLSDRNGFMYMHVEAGLGVCSQMVYGIELRRLAVESDCVRYWKILRSVFCGLVASFIESGVVLRLLV